MSTSQELTYPRPLQRRDALRGRRDGERRIPALAEVRRRQQELAATGGRLTVGYQVTLLAEFGHQLNEIFPAFQRAGLALAAEIGAIDDRIAAADEVVGERRDKLTAAQAPLTPEQLRPQSSHEEDWTPDQLRNRREVARARWIAAAQVELDAAIERVRQLRTERAAVVRRQEQALSVFAIKARQLAELYQRRIVAYLNALARSHPDGKTLYPLLEMPVVPLPTWVPEIAGVQLPDQDIGSEA